MFHFVLLAFLLKQLFGPRTRLSHVHRDDPPPWRCLREGANVHEHASAACSDLSAALETESGVFKTMCRLKRQSGNRKRTGVAPNRQNDKTAKRKTAETDGTNILRFRRQRATLRRTLAIQRGQNGRPNQGVVANLRWPGKGAPQKGSTQKVTFIKSPKSFV